MPAQQVGVALLIVLAACNAPPRSDPPPPRLLSASEEQALGEQLIPIAERSERFGGLFQFQMAEALVAAEADGLAGATGSSRSWRATILNTSTPRMLVLPPAWVGLSRGLLARLDHPDQVAALIAHGMARLETQALQTAWADQGWTEQLQQAARFKERADQVDTRGTALALVWAFDAVSEVPGRPDFPWAEVDAAALRWLANSGRRPMALLEAWDRAGGEAPALFGPDLDLRRPEVEALVAGLPISPESRKLDLSAFEAGWRTLAELHGTYQRYDEAVALAEQHQMVKSEQIFDEVIGRFRDQALFYVGKGNLFLDRALLSGSAARLFGQAIALQQNLYEAWFKAGLAYQIDKDSVNARIHLQQAARLLPHRPEPYLNLGLLAAEEARVTEARRWLQMVLGRAPEESSYHQRATTKLAALNEQ